MKYDIFTLQNIQVQFPTSLSAKTQNALIYWTSQHHFFLLFNHKQCKEKKPKTFQFCVQNWSWTEFSTPQMVEIVMSRENTSSQTWARTGLEQNSCTTYRSKWLLEVYHCINSIFFPFYLFIFFFCYPFFKGTSIPLSVIFQAFQICTILLWMLFSCAIIWAHKNWNMLCGHCAFPTSNTFWCNAAVCRCTQLQDGPFHVWREHLFLCQ